VSPLSSTVDGGDVVELAGDSPTDLLAAVVEWARRNGHELPDIEVRRPSLEDAYLRLTAEEHAS